MNFFRWMLGLPLAALVTLGLFILMTGLIRDEVVVDPPKATKDISILAKIIETPTTTTKPPRVDPADAPPPPDTKWNEPFNHDGKGVTSRPDPTTIDRNPPVFQGTTPIITVAPQYPEACRSRAAEGEVLVQFDVTDRGEVTNVRIISSDNSCFDRTVIRTVMGWKYPPEAQQGVIQKFVFSLNDE